MNRIISKLESVNPWHFIWVTVILAEIFTAVLNAVQSYVRWGFLSYELLTIGAIDALFVPAVVAPIIMIFLMRMSKLQTEVSLQKEFEKALRESEKKYRDLAELLPQFVFETNDKGNILFLNRHALENLGYTQDDFSKGLHAFQMFIPEDLDRVRENNQRVLCGEVLDGIEYTAKRKNGTAFPVLLSASPIVSENNITGIRGIAIDISERKKTEEALREGDETLRNILETTLDGFMRVDSNGNLLDINTTYCQQAGFTRDELIGMNISGLEAVENSAETRARRQRLIENGHEQFETMHRRKDGSIWHVEVSSTFLAVGGGQIFAFMRDISERKRIEQEQRKFVALVENSADFIGIASLEERVLYINGAGRKLVGIDNEDEARTKVISDFFFEEDLHELEETMLPSGFWQGEFRLKHFKTGLEIQVDLTGFLIRDLKTGEPLAHATITRDITDRKRAEDAIRKLNEDLEMNVKERTKQLVDAQEELVRKEKLATLGQLSGSVGHELRNPLGVMNNAVYYLKTVMSGANETVKEYLNIIKSEIDNAQRIISDLLDFSRSKTPRSELVMADELIKRSLGKCAVPKNITLRLDIPDTLLVVRVDPLHMEQVLQNLVTNAVQAMPDGGELSISARKVSCDVGAAPCGCPEEGEHRGSPLQNDNDFVEISISDTGEGISPENMKRLFQPLFTTKARGIGLGLTVVKNLTEANGGRIEVMSEAGKGTTFTVILPFERG